MSDDRSNVIARAVLEQAGNLCAFPGCGQRQYLEITHILSRQPGGPRYDPGEPVGTGTANVIVLCPTHHHLVDAEPHRFSAVVLRKMRDAQLERARRRTDADHGMGSQQQGLGSRPSDLAEALRIWDEHAAPQPEEYWHHLFEEIPELLVAAVPGDAVQLGSKCYVGGKSLDNRHGNIVDLIYTARSTSNATLVEIKTPEAKLVGGAYRDVFMPNAMGIRRRTVEHVFGTLKSWMGSTHFLTKTLKNVRTEMSLCVLAYNMKRMIQIMGVQPLIAAIWT